MLCVCSSILTSFTGYRLGLRYQHPKWMVLDALPIDHLLYGLLLGVFLRALLFLRGLLLVHDILLIPVEHVVPVSVIFSVWHDGMDEGLSCILCVRR